MADEVKTARDVLIGELPTSWTGAQRDNAAGKLIAALHTAGYHITPIASPVSEGERLERWEIQWPEYHDQGMGCGLEDRCIKDRYQAMAFGWDQAIERVAELMPDKLYTSTNLPDTPSPSPVSEGEQVRLDDALHNLITLARPHFSDEAQELALSEAQWALARLRNAYPDTASPSRDEDARDAARYRAIRAPDFDMPHIVHADGFELLSADDLDAAIDAALTTPPDATGEA